MIPLELSPEALRFAYLQGLFPMGSDDSDEVDYYYSDDRALFPISGIHVSHSLRKTIEKGTYEVTFDRAFADVMRSCRRPVDNWITEQLIEAYVNVHRHGWAHSCECWLDGELVGGVYGVAIRGCFCAESMFHRKTNASKVALWAMVEKCRSKGFVLFDAQMMNPHLRSLGAYSVTHKQYLQQLKKALRVSTDWDQYPNE